MRWELQERHNKATSNNWSWYFSTANKEKPLIPVEGDIQSTEQFNKLKFSKNFLHKQVLDYSVKTRALRITDFVSDDCCLSRWQI